MWIRRFLAGTCAAVIAICILPPDVFCGSRPGRVWSSTPPRAGRASGRTFTPAARRGAAHRVKGAQSIVRVADADLETTADSAGGASPALLTAAPIATAPDSTAITIPAASTTPTGPAPRPADNREHIAAVTDVVDIHAMLAATDFWPKIAAFSKPGLHPVDDLMSLPLLKYYFFGGGGLFPTLGRPALAMEHETLWPAVRGDLGKTADPQHYFVIGTDLHLDPILMPHEGLSDRYYPRREGDWLLEFYLPSYIYGADSTGELFPVTVESFSQRSQQLADFILYSQYDGNGDNAFSHDNYLNDYPNILRASEAQRWQYGFDDLFDTTWLDISGYQWSAHEPDLGVNAGSEALALVRSWEAFRQQKYLDAARNFLRYQLPRHGFHTGMWRGRRYYWLSATPDLDAIKSEDPVNSVEAMVAAPLAAVGYYTHDDSMIELARGLLWYLCREWETNGRWYYEGQENSAIQRDHPLLSQEAVCGQYAALTLPYLAAYGIDFHPELDSLAAPIHFLITHRPDSYPVEPSSTRYVRSWLTFGKTRGLRPGNPLLLRTYLQVTGAGANSMVLVQKLPDVVNRPAHLSVSISHNGQVSNVEVPVSSDGTYSVPVGAAPYKAWDLYSVDSTVTLNARFTVDEFPMEKPVVNVTSAPGGAAVSYTGDVQDYHYQTRINSQNFLDVPRWFYLPHNPGAGG